MKTNDVLLGIIKYREYDNMKKLLACSFSISLLLSGGVLSNASQAAAKHSVAATSQSTFQVPSKSSRMFYLKKGEKVVAASEPNIAIIEQLGNQKLLIRGFGIGTTNIVLLDKKNNVSRTITIEVTQNLDSLKKKLYQLLPNENIKVMNAQGRIVLAGQVSNLVNMDIAMRLAQAYASSTSGQQGSSTGSSSSSTGSTGSSQNSPNVINMMQIGGGQQVTLEVKIAEVSRTLTRKLGISRDASNNWKSNGNDFIWSALSAAAGVFTGSYLTGEVLFKWTIDFSKETGLATLLAEPNLTTLSGQKASFLSGGEFPYQVCNNQGTNQLGVVCNIGFKQFGVGLEFLPTVLDSSKINLNTHVSVSTLNNKAAEITGVETSTPSLALREAQTTIELADGQSMSIAGLLSDDNNGNQTQIPGFADLPLVGSLFRNRSATAEQKELVILVTPHLARPVPKNQIRLPTDAFVEPDDVDFYLLGKMETRKVKSLQPDNSNNVGVNGQFGHQINEGGRQ